jgi:hypothetical protein
MTLIVRWLDGPMSFTDLRVIDDRTDGASA